MNTHIVLAITIVGGLFTGYMAQRGGFRVLRDSSKESAKKYAGGVKADIIISGIIALCLFITAFILNSDLHKILTGVAILFIALVFYFIGWLIEEDHGRYEP